jgi:hypothetical protein
MFKNLARMIAVATFAVAAAAPVTASAAGSNNGIAVVIGHPITLQNRLLVTVPVTMTCALPITTNGQGGSLSVSIEQANRSSVSHGTGGLNFFLCPTTPTTFLIQITPDITPIPSGPFHKGRAIALASAFICDDNFPQTCVSGSEGWKSVWL